MSRIQPMGKFRSFVKQEPVTETSCSTGRYYPGQVLYAVAFTYEDQPFSSCLPPLSIHDKMPEKMHFIALTVTEHHKVPNHWDEENKLTCDGYVLKDKNGLIYHNQYPRASYGQLSDDSDRIFIRHFENNEDVQTALDNDKMVPFQYQSATDILERMERGTKQLAGSLSSRIRLSQLEKTISNFKKEFNNTFNKIIFTCPHKRFKFISEAHVVDSDKEMYTIMYRPVDMKLRLAMQACEKYKVDPNKRIPDGWYYRVSFSMESKQGQHHSCIKILGHHKKNSTQKQTKSRPYKSIHSGGKHIDYYYATDFAMYAKAYKHNAKTTALMKMLSVASKYDYCCIRNNTEDTLENFIEFKRNEAFEMAMAEMESHPHDRL